MDRAEWERLSSRALFESLRARGVRSLPARRLVEKRDDEIPAMLIDRAMGRSPLEPAPPGP